MPSISKAQAAALSDLGNIGNSRSDFGAVRLSVTENVLAQYGAEFKLKVVELLNQKQNIGQGALADSITPEIVNSATETILRIKLLDYYDFINEGVKGVKSSTNAPNSPYKFKTYGMSAEGRASLRQYILSGKAKVASVKRDVAYGTGLERKGKRLSEEDTRLNTLIFMIKKYGIKASHYFTQAFEQTFSDFETVMSEAVGADIILNLKQIGKK